MFDPSSGDLGKHALGALEPETWLLGFGPRAFFLRASETTFSLDGLVGSVLVCSLCWDGVLRQFPSGHEGAKTTCLLCAVLSSRSSSYARRSPCQTHSLFCWNPADTTMQPPGYRKYLTPPPHIEFSLWNPPGNFVQILAMATFPLYDFLRSYIARQIPGFRLFPCN